MPKYLYILFIKKTNIFTLQGMEIWTAFNSGSFFLIFNFDYWD
jgi:hypothetical protein